MSGACVQPRETLKVAPVAPGSFAFEVVLNECAARDVWRLHLRCEVARHLTAGQFVNLAVPGNASHILRIPFAPLAADMESECIKILYAVVGEGTERLTYMRPGDTSTLIGPLGRGWWLPDAVASGRALLVAGGVGLAPILACARMLANAQIGFDVVLGTRSWDVQVEREAAGAEYIGRSTCANASAAADYDPKRILIYTTDDGTSKDGPTKPRTAADGMDELLQERTYTQVYTCGPQPMMRAVYELARAHSIACQASLERTMGCGFGACSCCNVELAGGGYALCCKDGPVFDASEVCW